MNKVPGNYKGKWGATCPLCKKGEGDMEHYFECKMVMQLRKVWDVKMDDLSNDDIKKMTSLANFMENVETMIDPNQNSGYRGGICQAAKTEVSEDIGGHIEDEDMKKR